MPNYIVRLKDQKSFEDCCSTLHSLNKTHTKLKSLHAICVSIPSDGDRIEQLIDRNSIQRIEKDLTVSLIKDIEIENSNATSKRQTLWGLERIGALYTLIPKQYPRPRVAILDTGLSKHPSLNISSLYTNFTKESSALDLNGHGTHLAGTIGGYYAHKNRRATFHGIYPKCPIHAVKAFTKDGTSTTSTIIQGIEWCIEHNVNIINMSFGLSEHHQTLHEAIQLAQKRGILLVAACGNNGKPGLDFPARYPEVISVGSINKKDQISDFSQFGTNLDVVAPGENILSTWLGRTYKTLSGTSMACAHVTGTLALMLAIQPKLSNTEAKQMLVNTTESLSTSYLLQGNGLISVSKMLNQLKQ